MYEVKYPAFMKQYKLKRADLVSKTGKLYDQAEKVIDEIKNLYAQMEQVDEEEKEQFLGKIQTAEATLEVMDDELVGRIPKNNTWKGKGDKMRAGRGAAGKAGQSPAQTPPVEPVVETPAAGTEPTPAAASTETAPVQTPPAEPAATTTKTPVLGEGGKVVPLEEKKKGKNVGGIIVGSILGLTAIWLGVNYVQTGDVLRRPGK